MAVTAIKNVSLRCMIKTRQPGPDRAAAKVLMLNRYFNFGLIRHGIGEFQRINTRGKGAGWNGNQS